MIARIGIKPKADIYDRAGIVIGTKRTSASLNFDPLTGLRDVYRNILIGHETHPLIFRMTTKEKLGYWTLDYSVDLHRCCSSTRWHPGFRSSSLLSH
jgi:hypothetical protein